MSVPHSNRQPAETDDLSKATAFPFESLVSGVILLLIPVVAQERAISEFNRVHATKTFYLLFGMMLVGCVFCISVIRSRKRVRLAKRIAFALLLATISVWAVHI